MNGRRTLPGYTVPLYDTTTLTSALANPYAQHYAPHYYHAYMQAYSNGLPRTTREGYTLSSTYVPGMEYQTGEATLPPLERPSMQSHSPSAAKPILNYLTHGAWYQPGNCRCTRKGCPFSGSRKSVEIHMMDRHFIFPPGWKKRDDWDADPSLRGKPIAIQGTSIALDTPEAIDDWIAERKRRFPTDQRVQDKKRKLEEAISRGQLTPQDIGASARKRYRQTSTLPDGGDRHFRRQGHQRGRGRRQQNLVRREEFKLQITNDLTSQSTRTKSECVRETNSNSGSATDEDEAPEVLSSKIPTVLPMPNVDAKRNSESASTSLPKKPPRNPFASRSTLLRNLLLPEIRVTVSNLSQAIHFLVENGFLRDVELRPGEAQEQMIEVLAPRETPCSATLPSHNL